MGNCYSGDSRNCSRCIRSAHLCTPGNKRTGDGYQRNTFPLFVGNRSVLPAPLHGDSKEAYDLIPNSLHRKADNRHEAEHDFVACHAVVPSDSGIESLVAVPVEMFSRQTFTDNDITMCGDCQKKLVAVVSGADESSCSFCSHKIDFRTERGHVYERGSLCSAQGPPPDSRTSMLQRSVPMLHRVRSMEIYADRDSDRDIHNLSAVSFDHIDVRRCGDGTLFTPSGAGPPAPLAQFDAVDANLTFNCNRHTCAHEDCQRCARRDILSSAGSTVPLGLSAVDGADIHPAGLSSFPSTGHCRQGRDVRNGHCVSSSLVVRSAQVVASGSNIFCDADREPRSSCCILRSARYGTSFNV